MTLLSYGGLEELAGRAARRRKQSTVAKSFYRTLYAAIQAEVPRQRRIGDKQALVGCLRAAMDALLLCLQAEKPDIQRVNYRIPVAGLHGKAPDYGVRRGARVYLVEQKSILRFNEFAQVAFEAMLAKTHCPGDDIRFAGFFNYLHQSRSAFDNLCTFEGRRWVDHLCVLIPRIEYDDYSSEEVDALYEDMRAWVCR